MGKKIYLIISLSIIIAGCSKYGSVTLRYPTNPSVYFPENINSIAIINRSLVKESEKPKTILESITSAEVAGSDKLASDDCLKGVFDRLNGWRDIKVIYPKEIHYIGTGTRETPNILDWKIVKEICTLNSSDALLVLETFDSNSDLAASVIGNQVTSLINNQKPAVGVPNHIRVNVKYFWRMYDPKSETIIDQYSGTRYFEYDSQVINLAVAPPEALANTAYSAGQEYVERFFPGYYSVRRDMYKRGKGHSKEDFKTAFRKAEVANWEGAIDVWTKILNNAGRTSAGRACLNIAVGYEVLGNNKKALEWAKKSYEDYGDKIGRNYANSLKYRINLEN